MSHCYFFVCNEIVSRGLFTHIQNHSCIHFIVAIVSASVTDISIIYHY
jgi:hypothetical protein